MNTVIFELTSEKTIVIATGKSGIDKIDITDTEIEKDFTVLLKKIREYREEKQILNAIDVNNWSVKFM